MVDLSSLTAGICDCPTTLLISLGLGVVAYQLLRAPHPTRKHAQRFPASQIFDGDNADPEFDYVIVGAGSAGCVLANRLSKALPKAKILLIEAGPELHKQKDHHTSLSQWFGFFMKEVDWDFTYGPEPYINNRTLHAQRGKTTGGCSTINALMWVRGNKEDYDGWDELCAGKDNPGWSYKDVLPFFKSIEGSCHGDNHYRNSKGEMKTRVVKGHREGEAFLQAAVAAKHPLNPDSNGETQTGVGYTESSSLPGERQDVFSRFIDPIIDDTPNLTVISETLVRKVIFEGKRAVGVEVETSSHGIRTIRAKKEVHLAAGGCQSPQILLLSGVGPASELKQHGIDVVADVAKVGKDMQEHYSCSVVYELKESVDPRENHTGINATGFYMSEWNKKNAPGRGNDMQIAFAGGEIYTYAFGNVLTQKFLGFAPADTLKGRILRNLIRGANWMFRNPLHGIAMKLCSINVICNQTNSRGYVTINSTDPHDKPKMVGNLGEKDEDISRLVEGVRVCRNIGEQKAFKDLVVTEKEPGAHNESDKDIETYVRQRGFHAWHIAGTCVMGSSNESVVDPCLRVRGVTGLRVIDCSIMPTVCSGNTNAPSLMIGARGADIVLSTDA